jgi:protein phosphatase
MYAKLHGSSERAGRPIVNREVHHRILETVDWIQKRSSKTHSSFSDGGFYLASSKGDVRSENEDRVALIHVRNQVSNGAEVKAVAMLDGIGGMSSGGSAASLALASFATYLCFGDCTRGLKSLLLGACVFANENVYAEHSARGGSTISAVLFGKQGAVGLNIGDSRIYLISDNHLSQLTEDDTISGSLPTSSQRLEPWKYPEAIDNRLAQFVGMGDAIQPHLIALPPYDTPESDAHLLLVTDGAYYVGQSILEALTTRTTNFVDLADRVLEVAGWLGSQDNASIAIAPCRPSFEPQPYSNGDTSLTLKAFGDTLVILAPKSTAPITVPLQSAQLGPVRPVEAQLAVVQSRDKATEPSTKGRVATPPNKKKKKGRTKKQKKQTDSLILEFVPEKR